MQKCESFLRAVQEFKKGLPSLRERFSEQVDQQIREHAAFRTAFLSCFDVLACCIRQAERHQDQSGLFPRHSHDKLGVTREQFATFFVQSMLLKPLLGWMFPDALVNNQIALHIEKMAQTFEHHAWLRLSLDGYFPLIARELRACRGRREKQEVFRLVCEHFLHGFDPRRAEELGVIYTPIEIVEFLCASCEEQMKHAYGRSLSSVHVPILDPCTGIGTFLVTILERIDPGSLPYKYTHELFGIEIMLFPWYIATLNIEQAFFERTGQYQPFRGMRYADALLT